MFEGILLKIAIGAACLNDNSFHVRQAAHEYMENVAPLAYLQMQQSSVSKYPEVRSRACRILYKAEQWLWVDPEPIESPYPEDYDGLGFRVPKTPWLGRFVPQQIPQPVNPKP